MSDNQNVHGMLDDQSNDIDKLVKKKDKRQKSKPFQVLTREADSIDEDGDSKDQLAQMCPRMEITVNKMECQDLRNSLGLKCHLIGRMSSSNLVGFFNQETSKGSYP